MAYGIFGFALGGEVFDDGEGFSGADQACFNEFGSEIDAKDGSMCNQSPNE